MLGYPDTALKEAEDALRDARAMDDATALILTLAYVNLTHMLSGNYVAANKDRLELTALAEKTGSFFWKTVALSIEARDLALTGDPAKALPMISSARNAFRSTGANHLAPLDLAVLARTHAALGNFEDAQRSIAEAMTTLQINKERWFEVEVYRIVGEIALKSPAPDAAKAERYFDRALEVARKQHAKGWELRAATSRRASGATRARCSKLANCLLRFTAGLRRASTRSI